MSEDGFRATFNNSLQAAASTGGVFAEEAFINEVSRRFTEAEEVDTLIPCHHRTVGAKGRILRIDGYDLGDEEGHIVVAVSDFEPGEQRTLGSPDALKLVTQARGWVEGALDGTMLAGLEESSPAFELAWEIHSRRESTFKVRIYLLTNNSLSARLKELPAEEIDGISYEYHLWDIERFRLVEESTRGREEIDIDLTEWAADGIPVLAAPITANDVATYLAIIPGDVLAAIYRRYGARVLESNVRSYLSLRRKVNKGIRGTIMQEPELFLTFNNGITATAGEVKVITADSGPRMTALRDLQIVNGGQTTASIFYVDKDDRDADLSNVFVQMKLTVVDSELASDLVPKISRYANTQNAVSEADFFSNHDFHKRMEEKSRRILAPAKPGARFQTKWFYERTRGQYASERSKLSTAGMRQFDVQYPKSQLLTKTDAAKYLNSWSGRPHVVSAGAQKNFLEFAKSVEEQWKRNSEFYSEDFFRALISKKILFDTIRSRVMAADWYTTGYLANIVTYTMAKLAQIASGQSMGGDLNFSAIWQEQAVDDRLLELIDDIAWAVYLELTDDSRPVVNVTEWAKREKCWDAVQTLEVREVARVKEFVVFREQLANEAREAKLDQRLLNGIEAQVEVTKLGQRYWSNLRDFVRTQGIATEKDLSIIRYATGEAGRVPSEAQAQLLVKLDRRANEAGFVGN
jgi:hypothetical protein